MKRSLLFVLILMVPVAAQASPPLPSQAAFDAMTCTQAVQATMSMMLRSEPAWRKLPRSVIAAVQMVNRVEPHFQHHPCQVWPPRSAPNSSPSVTIRRPDEKGR